MPDIKAKIFYCLRFVFILLFLSVGCSVKDTYQQTMTEGNRLLVYDFGTVRPRSERKHTFILKNPTDVDWKIRRIVENCSCTVANTPADVIPAGGSLDVELTYRSGTEFIDDKRDTVVEFEQDNILPFTLQVKSQIRPQIVLQPPHVSISSYEPDQQYQEAITVNDWSDTGLKTVEFRSDDPWISVAAPVKKHDVDTSAPFPPWKGTLLIDAKGLPPGRHSGRVDIIARENGLEYSSYLTVLLDITSPVRIVPSDLFFGEVKPNETATIRCSVLVAPGRNGTAKSRWESITITSDLPSDVLKAEIVKETESRGTLLVALTPQTSEHLKGNVVIQFEDNQFNPLILPVIASIQNKPLTHQKEETSNESTD